MLFVMVARCGKTFCLWTTSALHVVPRVDGFCVQTTALYKFSMLEALLRATNINGAAESGSAI
jgi:hypothetical protein